MPGEAARRLAVRAIARLHEDEVADIAAELEAGGDADAIVADRRTARAPAGGTAGVLAGLRRMVDDRLTSIAAGHDEPWTGPVVMPCGVDFGEVDMALYAWMGVVLGVALAQNAVDSDPDAAGRAIPARFMFWDAQFPGFWDGGDIAGQPSGPPAGWPLVTTTPPSLRTGAA